MAEVNPSATAKMLQEIQATISAAQALITTLEDVGADTEELRAALASSVEKNLLECYGAPTLARYIVRNAIVRYRVVA